MKVITQRQHVVLKAITRFQVDHDGASPSIRDLARLLRVKSDNGVMKHLAALEKKGAITRVSRGPSGLRRGLAITPEAKRQLVAKWTAADPAIFVSFQPTA